MVILKCTCGHSTYIAYCPFLLIVTVDCRWTSWSDWTSCSKTCGAGVREKSRQVQTPARNGGSQCLGSPKQIESCNDQDCPSKFKNGNLVKVCFNR